VTYVQSIDIVAQMDRSSSVRVDVVQRHLDDLTDAVLVDLVHGECLNVVLLQDLLLAGVDISKTDVDDRLRVEAGREPVGKDRLVGSGQAKATRRRREEESMCEKPVGDENRSYAMRKDGEQDEARKRREHEQEGHRAAVKVSGVGRLRGIDISVSIDL
jgi:hypothetical protein